MSAPADSDGYEKRKDDTTYEAEQIPRFYRTTSEQVFNRDGLDELIQMQLRFYSLQRKRNYLINTGNDVQSKRILR